jgi:hypothetical protein
MTPLRSWATERALIPSQTDYVARTPVRQALRFSASGDESIEQFLPNALVSRELPEKKRERLLEKASRAPELVVIQPLNKAWKCHKCGENGDLLVMENPGPACLRCVGLDDLEFLSAGDALLTRRSRRKALAMPWLCDSAGPAAATSGAACCSRRKPWTTRNASSPRSRASAAIGPPARRLFPTPARAPQARAVEVEGRVTALPVRKRKSGSAKRRA